MAPPEMRYADGAAGDWLSGRALRSHRRGHWFDPSIAHAGQRPVPFSGTGLFDLPSDLRAAAKCGSGRARVAALVEEARAHGASAVAGGRPVGRDGLSWINTHTTLSGELPVRRRGIEWRRRWGQRTRAGQL